MPANNMIIRFIFILLFMLQPVLSVSAEVAKCVSLENQDLAGSQENNRVNFEQQFTVAEGLRQSAARTGAEWLETEDLLTGARKEAARGNWKPAARLIEEACNQAELALQQAEYESGAWKSRVVD